MIDATELPFPQSYIDDIYTCIVFGWKKYNYSHLSPSEAKNMTKLYLDIQLLGVPVLLVDLLYGLGLYPFDLDSLTFARNL